MDDFPILVDHFLESFAEEHGLGLKQIDSAGMKELARHSWPGNVRELKNVIERLSIMVPGEVISRDDILKHLEAYDYDDIMTKDTSSLKKAREEFEKDYLIRVLKKNDKNITLTSKELGIERTNLHRKIKQYNININKI
jgi:DNA-binding NtrC family response regulator